MLGSQTKGNILKDSKVWKEHIILEHITERSLLWWHRNVPFAIKVDHIVERDMPSLRMEKSRQQTQNSTFARATLTKQNGCLTNRGREVQREVKGVQMSVK